MTMDEATRDALLVRLDERTERLVYVIEGNGQPGLITKVAKLEQRADDRDRVAVKAGSLAAAVTAIISLGLAHFGIKI